jgi:hypothetical protein
MIRTKVKATVTEKIPAMTTTIKMMTADAWSPHPAHTAARFQFPGGARNELD